MKGDKRDIVVKVRVDKHHICSNVVCSTKHVCVVLKCYVCPVGATSWGSRIDDDGYTELASFCIIHAEDRYQV